MEPPGCPGVTRESRGVSGSFGECLNTVSGPGETILRTKRPKLHGGGPGLVWDLDSNYAPRVSIGIFVKKKRPKLHGGVGAF